MAAVYQFVKARKCAGLVDARVCDSESELSNGTFVTTSNAEVAQLASMPPEIKSTKHPAGTEPAELHRLHGLATAEALRKNPDTTLTVVRTIEDLDAAQQRQQAIKAVFRKGVGFIDAAEVRRIAGRKFGDDAEMVDRAQDIFEDARRESEADDQNM